MRADIRQFAYGAIADFMALVREGNTAALRDRYDISVAIYEEILEELLQTCDSIPAFGVPPREVLFEDKALSVFDREDSLPEAVQTWGVECNLFLDGRATELTLSGDIYVTSTGVRKFQFKWLGVM